MGFNYSFKGAIIIAVASVGICELIGLVRVHSVGKVHSVGQVHSVGVGLARVILCDWL
jgi:hypothetical protein